MDKPSRQSLLLLTLALAALLLAVPIIQAQGPNPSAPTHARAPEATLRAKAPYPGIYIFLDRAEVGPEEYPFLRGGNMIFPWRDIEVADQVFDWSIVDEWLDAQVALGKSTSIGFSLYNGRCCGGEEIPSWMIWEHEDDVVVRCDEMHWAIPRYWNDYFLHQYREYIQAFAERYDNDPRVTWIQIGTGIFGEAKPSDVVDFQCMLDAGLTPELWVETSMDIIDMFSEAFQNTPLLYQFAPVYVIHTDEGQIGSISQRRFLTDYAVSRGLGLKHNGLKPDMDFALVDNPDKSYYKAGSWDPIYTWWREAPIAWESYATQTCLDPITGEQSAEITMWCVYAGLAGHADYFVFSKDLVTDPGRAPWLEFAQHYLGAEVNTTDSVWVALRETEYHYYPAKGNFSFWLYQNDDVYGGKTVPEWRVTEAMEGRYTRRTDRKSGNPNMYFDVDNAWLYRNENTTVTIDVTYLDRGWDTWSLYYDAVDNPEKLAGTVRKTDSGAWLTQTFTLTDAYFGDRLPGGGDRPGSDFYLASDDFDDYFHRVLITRDDIAPTPTPPPPVTLTPTPPPGPDDPTPTPTPSFLRLRQGYQGYTGVEDTWIGTWCAGFGENDGDRNHGNEPVLAVRAYGSPNELPYQSVCSALLRFDVSRIPRGSTIIEARLVVKGVWQSNSARLYLNTFDLYKPWLESQATWFQAQAGIAWDQPGADGAGDHPELPLDMGYLSGPAEQPNGGWAAIYITPLVQQWVDHPEENRGVLLRPFANQVEWHLASSEHPTELYRPQLEIRYYPPGQIPPTATPTPTPQPTPTPIPNTSVIQGTVYHDRLSTGSPAYNPGIPDVELRLENQDTNEIRTTTTDHRGRYQFINVPPGTYLLKEIQPVGWTKAHPADSILLTVVANQTYIFDFGHDILPDRYWLPLITR